MKMTLNSAINNWQKHNPEYFMVAADHRFGCDCPDCITFFDASAKGEPDWTEFKISTDLDFNTLDIVQPYIPEDARAQYKRLLNELG